MTENYPADRIPKVGDEIKSTDKDEPATFVIKQVKHLLVPRAKETIRAVQLHKRWSTASRELWL